MSKLCLSQKAGKSRLLKQLEVYLQPSKHLRWNIFRENSLKMHLLKICIL